MPWPKDPEKLVLAKERLREAQKKFWTPEMRARQAEKTRGQFHSPEARKKSSDAQKKTWTPEKRARWSQMMRDRFITHPDLRERFAEFSRRQFSDPEARKRMSEIKKAFYVLHPEAKEKISEHAKKKRAPRPPRPIVKKEILPTISKEERLALIRARNGRVKPWREEEKKQSCPSL